MDDKRFADRPPTAGGYKKAHKNGSKLIRGRPFRESSLFADIHEVCQYFTCMQS